MTIHEVFSNSLNSADDPSRSPTPAQRPSALLCAEIGHTMKNYGVSGGMSQDMAYAAHGLPAAAADTEIWLLDMLTNDARLRGQNSIGSRWSRDFITATLIARLFAVKKTARFDATATSGNWGNTQVDPLGMYTTSSGAKKTFSAKGPAIAVCWYADYDPASQGVFEVRIDGNLVDTIYIAIPYGNTFKGLRYGPAARVYATSEGAHNVELKSISSGTYAYFSYVAGSGDQSSLPKAFIGTGMKCPGSASASGVPAAFVSANRQMVLDHVAFLKSLSLPVEAVDTAAADIELLPDGVHETVNGAVQMKNIMSDVRRQPQRLTWPIAGGGRVYVDLNKYGECTAYGQL